MTSAEPCCQGVLSNAPAAASPAHSLFPGQTSHLSACLLWHVADAASSELSGEAAASDDSSAEEPEDSSGDEEAEDAEQSGALHSHLTSHFDPTPVKSDAVGAAAILAYWV